MFKYRKTPALLTLIVFLAATILSGCGGAGSGTSSRETVKISIGYQARAAQSWGALIIKNKKLFEKHLTEKFPDKDFKVEWVNLQSDPSLSDNLIAGKLQMAFMGDMQSLINGEKGQTLQNYKSVFIAVDGKVAEVKTLTLDGNQIKVDSMDGIVGNRAWVENNRGYVISFTRALIEAHRFISQKPEEALTALAAESGNSLEAARKAMKNVRYDAAIYHKDVKNFKANRESMKKSGKIKDVDLATFFNDFYIKEAAKEMKAAYPSEQQLAGEWLGNLKL